MPMNINLHANTKVPGMAPPLEVLKPVPEAPPLPLRHTLDVKQPQLLTHWRAFADLEDRPLTLRVLATPYKMHRSLVRRQGHAWIPIRSLQLLRNHRVACCRC